MSKYLPLAAVFVVSALVGVGPVSAQPTNRAAQTAKALEIGGPELRDDIMRQCNRPSGPPPPGDPNMYRIWAEPRRLFDNLYWMGSTYIGASAVKTPAGIVMIDTLDSQVEAQDQLEPQMRKLGLEPRQIKFIFLTHGHLDHIGGAAYLQRRYHARVAMAAPDWTFMSDPKFVPRIQLMADKPRRDISLKDGDSFTFGGFKFVALATPGHTPGSVTYILQVMDHGRRIHVMLPGAGLPMQSSEAFASFRAKVDRAAPDGIAAIVGSHPQSANFNVRQTLAKGGDVPLWSKATFDRFMDAAAQCTDDKLS